MSEIDAQAAAFRRNSLHRTLVVPIAVSFCCALLVAGAATLLRPQHLLNQEHNRQQNILAVAGFEVTANQTFEELVRRVIVDLETGRALEQHQLPEPAVAVAIDPEVDPGNLGVRSRYQEIYHVYQEGRLERIILPVSGQGLWSTLHGYLALNADASTVVGLRFHEHAETPGLGGEISDPAWQARWRGKQIFDDAWHPVIEVVKGRVSGERNPLMIHQVDGISGATLTGRGVTRLLRYWLGEHGFAPYLKRLHDAAGADR